MASKLWHGCYSAFIQIYSENSEPEKKTNRGSAQFGEERDTNTLKAVDKTGPRQRPVIVKEMDVIREEAHAFFPLGQQERWHWGVLLKWGSLGTCLPRFSHTGT